ncbi:MAG TPA: zinc-dependent alcohol dehydrogenase family protein [Actinomycetota bacterium]|nr:zinc-dependent alcohol dehydrogenase family protein [Actinomycetota bacterium]
MRAWVVASPAPIDEHPLRLVERPVPDPGPGEVLVKVSHCGVCRTDLHLAEGDLAPRRPEVVPGHEVVGTVAALGPGARRFQEGDRIGVAWLRSTDGSCRFCAGDRENLCLAPTFTGWDTDGGYAEYTTVPEHYAYALPAGLPGEQIAPLLCAGIIGYRALQRAELPPGGRLGLYGFGGSAHLTMQVALDAGARVHVLTRGEAAQAQAREMGAASVGGAYDAPPEPLDAAILYAPVGDLVPVALAALDRGGTLAVAGIHLTDIPPLNYQEHLFQERTLRSVTANTRADGREFLAAAARIPVRPTVTTYPFEEAGTALADLAHGAFIGAAVLAL